MIQHTGQILFFAIQHASPGPSQQHLHPMQQTPERIHSVHPHCRMMNPETTCHKFNAPHWFSSFSNPFHVPVTRFPESHTLPVSIARIKTDARIGNKSRCCLQIIKSKRLIFCKVVRCMSLSRRILFYRFCQFCNKICDTIGKEAPHIQPCLRCPDFVFIYLHCNVFERCFYCFIFLFQPFLKSLLRRFRIGWIACSQLIAQSKRKQRRMIFITGNDFFSKPQCILLILWIRNIVHISAQRCLWSSIFSSYIASWAKFMNPDRCRMHRHIQYYIQFVFYA